MSALMERLGLGGREMTTTGHSKDFVLKVVPGCPSIFSCEAGKVWGVGATLTSQRFGADLS
jgi:hypothetical protein